MQPVKKLEDTVMARLDKICSLNMGQSPGSFSYNEKGEGIPFFKVMRILEIFIHLYVSGVMSL